MITSTIKLNKDLNKIRNWEILWKMKFNPNLSKRAQEVVFSSSLSKTSWSYLDNKLNFQEHLNNVLNKVNKTIGLLSALQVFLPRQSLVTV